MTLVRVRRRRDVGTNVVEVAWPNGDRFYGKGSRLIMFAKAAVARYWNGRRSWPSASREQREGRNT